MLTQMPYFIACWHECNEEISINLSIYHLSMIYLFIVYIHFLLSLPLDLHPIYNYLYPIYNFLSEQQFN